MSKYIDSSFEDSLPNRMNDSDNGSYDPEEYSIEEEEAAVKKKEDYKTDEEGDSGMDENKRDQKSSSYLFLLLINIMINPVEGWKKFRRRHPAPETTARGCFYPLIALSAASCFIAALYDTSLTLNECLISAVKIFMTFFFGNFLTLLLFRLGLPRQYQKIGDSDYGKNFVMINLSSLALFYTLYELLPMLGPILVFLPLWTVYTIIRGCRFFKFPQEKGNLLMTLISLYIICSPIAIYWIFDILL